MKTLLKVSLFSAGYALASSLAMAEDIPVRWLDGAAPVQGAGLSWGVPFARGTVRKEQAFVLHSAEGKVLPLQNWPLAYWPDGSLKWSGFATVAGSEQNGGLTLSTTDTAVPVVAPLRVTESADSLVIDTGKLTARLARHGSSFIDSLVIDGREVARQGQLVCILQDGPERDPVDAPAREKFVSSVEKVSVEQAGPVRAVVKIEGHHKGLKNAREWLPFVVRLYFYTGQESIRVVHTIVYDGSQEKDFIRGLGLVFSVPMREEIQNRHVRFSGEGEGLWSEPIQPMKGRDKRFVEDPVDGHDVYPEQIAGKRVPNKAQVNARSQGWLGDWAIWDGFKLVQPTADGFTIVKRTNLDSCWLPADAGKRASGLVFVGDVSGGLAVSLKNFWQSYPAALEVEKAATSAAELSVWFWSPDAPAMDLRHYDTRAHGLEAAYEDVQPGFSTATGVGRTSELMLYPCAGVPGKDETAHMAQAGAKPSVLICTPQYLHHAQAFGIWGLEDRSTPVKRAIEERLESTVDFYLKQVGQRNWYGFWDFGDVMHSYDGVRHAWRYDLGGMAWDNSELGTDMWLWYSFLHTGRADIFRMAEAMTRHTGEVDTYHAGPFKGLGSRHNVRHWGCGAKEARISQAGYRRFYYYLTTDERTGDVMHDALLADYKATEYDPMRFAQPATEAEKKLAPGRVRLGPDWVAFLGNWMTEWERTGDPQWRDKILAGVRSLGAMPLGLRSGKNLVFGYNPQSGKLFQLSEEAGIYNLATIMGGAEVVFELNQMLDDEQWQKLWLQYCRLYTAPAEVIRKDMNTWSEGSDASYVRDGRLASYVYLKTHNSAFRQAGIKALLSRRNAPEAAPLSQHLEGSSVLKPLDEAPWVSTNGAAQEGLETITMLGMVGDVLPAEAPSEPEGGHGRPPRNRR